MDKKPEKPPFRNFYWSLMGAMVLGSVITLTSQAAYYMIQQKFSTTKADPSASLTASSPDIKLSISTPPPPPSSNSVPPPPTATPIKSVASPAISATPLSSPSPAATPLKNEPVKFDVGSTETVLKGTLKTNQLKRYVLECQSDQRMTVQLQEGKVNLVVIAPDGKKISAAITSTQPWQGKLPLSGDYAIEVFAASQSDYQIKVEVLSLN